MSAWYLPTLAFASASWAIAVCSLLSATTTTVRLHDHLPVQLDLRHLLLMFLVQLGNENLGQRVAFLHLVADVHVELLDKTRNLGVDRRLLDRRPRTRAGLPCR